MPYNLLFLKPTRWQFIILIHIPKLPLFLKLQPHTETLPRHRKTHRFAVNVVFIE